MPVAYGGAAKVNFGWKLGPFIMAPVNHSPARNKNTTTALLTYNALDLSQHSYLVDLLRSNATGSSDELILHISLMSITSGRRSFILPPQSSRTIFLSIMVSTIYLHILLRT